MKKKKQAYRNIELMASVKNHDEGDLGRNPPKRGTKRSLRHRPDVTKGKGEHGADSRGKDKVS